MNGVLHMGGMVMNEPFVYNEKGFLLLEHLISIAIVSILSIILVYLMQVVSIYRTDQTSLTMHEVNTVAIRMQNEIRFADSLTGANNQLYAHFTTGNRVVNFTFQNNRLVRQVGGRGGEILIYNLFGMEVVLFDSRSARVSLVSFDGDIFQFYLSIIHIEVQRPEIEVVDEKYEEE